MLHRERSGRASAEDTVRRLEHLAGRAEEGAAEERKQATGAARALEEARREWTATERELQAEVASSRSRIANLEERLLGVQMSGSSAEEAADSLREKLRGAEEAWSEAAAARGEA